MAILEDVPGINVSVAVDGVPLYEHTDQVGGDAEQENDKCPVVSRYIECTDNTPFTIQITVDHDYEFGYRNHSVVARAYVDGSRVRGEIIRSGDTFLGPCMRTIRGQEIYSDITQLWNIRRFQFSVVDTIDEAQKDRVEKDMKVAKGLGVIEVRITRAIEYGPTFHHNMPDPKSGKFELAEKSLKGKAISHGTSYLAPESILAPTFVDCRDLVEDNGPIAIFRFLYRSREALKRELIIPRSPTPEPTIAHLSEAERNRLARERLEEIRVQRMKVKKEHSNAPLIKRELGEVLDLTDDSYSSRAAKKPRPEVVDLTDD
ncbi:hypothetical protein F5Y15DRAFT_150910 [Xylariaceae sp. FL0016]|nr:hypothetical protein F5Y15DRAFT_150910 [Xylariaceae sp. FL0016]